jgi:hypothetical protein
MKKNWILSNMFIFVLTAGIEAGGTREFPRLQGPYMGQKPPEMTPQLFAPGIITTDEVENIPARHETGYESGWRWGADSSASCWDVRMGRSGPE